MKSPSTYMSICTLITTLGLSLSIGYTNDSHAESAQPDKIIAERGGFMPEGVDYDNVNKRFLTGSITEGTIYTLTAKGKVEAVFQDGGLGSTVGIEVDEARNRVIVANSNATVFQTQSGGMAQVVIFDLQSGKKLAQVSLDSVVDNPNPAFFANDLTVGDQGEIYVTDTFQGIVYKVDKDYKASVFHRFQRGSGVQVNGIEFHPKGFLLVADVGGGTIYKMPIADPAKATKIKLEQPLSGPDGLRLTKDLKLVVVQNQKKEVVVLESSDDWQSAKVAKVGKYNIAQGTTAALVGDDIYVVQPHFMDAEPPAIEKVQF